MPGPGSGQRWGGGRAMITSSTGPCLQAGQEGLGAHLERGLTTSCLYPRNLPQTPIEPLPCAPGRAVIKTDKDPVMRQAGGGRGGYCGVGAVLPRPRFFCLFVGALCHPVRMVLTIVSSPLAACPQPFRVCGPSRAAPEGGGGGAAPVSPQQAGVECWALGPGYTSPDPRSRR